MKRRIKLIPKVVGSGSLLPHLEQANSLTISTANFKAQVFKLEPWLWLVLLLIADALIKHYYLISTDYVSQEKPE